MHLLRHPDKVVGGHDVLAFGGGAFDSLATALAEATSGLRPAGDLLEAFADLLPDGVGAREQDMQRLLPVLARGMGHHALFAHFEDELLRVVFLVTSDLPRSEASIA